MPIKRSRSFRTDFTAHRKSNANLTDQFNLFNNISIPDGMSDFSFEGSKWKREIEMPDAKMETVKGKFYNVNTHTVGMRYILFLINEFSKIFEDLLVMTCLQK